MILFGRESRLDDTFIEGGRGLRGGRGEKRT